MPIDKVTILPLARLARVPAERALLQREPRLLSGIRGNNAEDVEAAGRLAIARQATEITPRDRNDVAAFVQRYGGRWRSKAVVAACLDLDKAECAVVPADQVDLSAIVRRAEVGCHKLVALGFQIKVRLGFAMLAQRKMAWLARADSL